METIESVLVTCSKYQATLYREKWPGANLEDMSATSVLMVQIVLAALFTGTIDFFLRRHGFCSYFSHVIGAIIIGPKLLGGYSEFLKNVIFSYQGIYVLEIMRYFANIYLTFLVGLKMDLRMIKGSGRKAVIIGVSVGFLPVVLTYLFSSICKRLFFPTEPQIWLHLCSVALTIAQSSFHVVAMFLADLKLLNTAIGRLAISSSMISNIVSFSTLMLAVSLQQSKGKLMGFIAMFGSLTGIILFIIYVLRPIMYWMIKRTPEGSIKMRQVYVLVVFLMVLVCAQLGIFCGQTPGLAPLILGLLVPPGPPLAEAIEDKLECMLSSVFLPLFYLASCGIVNTGVVNPQRVMVVGMIILLATFLKIIITLLASMYCGMSFDDSFVLGLIMASLGLMDLIFFRASLRFKHINAEVYTVFMYFSVAIAGVTSILVKVLYKQREYSAITKRAIGDSTRHNNKLQILTCIYREFNVPSVLDLLEASNATYENPIGVYLLHLIQLRRIAPPLVISHKRNEDHTFYYDRSKTIINAFRYFEEKNIDKVMLNSYSALSPSSTMHQDICSLAADNGVALIVLPFHKQLNSDGIMEDTPVIRNVNSNVLKFSPCSVGIFVDQRHMSATSMITQNKSFSHIAILFLGGEDDREVLNYGMRMVENPNTYLTVIRFKLTGDLDRNILRENKLDTKMLADFWNRCIGRNGVTYREEEVSDGYGIVKAVKEIENEFDLIMVGRQHKGKSKIFKGISEWNEHPELGYMGDMLATSNSLDDVPILVMQQYFQSSNDSSEGSTDYRIEM